MKNFLKTLLVLTLATAFLLTGCETPNVSSETPSSPSDNILSDEQALEIVAALEKKASGFNSFIYQALEFGEYKLDELDTFEDYDFKYAEFHIENMLEYLDSEIFYELFPKEEFHFSSRQDIYDYIETFSITAEAADYAVELAFEDRNGKLYYNTQEISAVGMFTVENIAVVSKTKDTIVFSGNRSDNGETFTEFSMLKNSDGEWRLNWDFFRDSETQENNKRYQAEEERYVAAVVASEIDGFDSQSNVTLDDIFVIWQVFVFDGTNIDNYDEFYFSAGEEDYFYSEAVENFARKYFKKDMQQYSGFDPSRSAYRRTIYSIQKYKVNFTKIEEHGLQTHYYFEYTSPYITETKTGVFVMGNMTQSLRFD